MDRQGPAVGNEREQLQLSADALVDLPILMTTMQQAIRQAVAQNIQRK